MLLFPKSPQKLHFETLNNLKDIIILNLVNSHYIKLLNIKLQFVPISKIS